MCIRDRLQTPSSPQIHNLPLDYFYSATLAPFYSALDRVPENALVPGLAQVLEHLIRTIVGRTSALYQWKAGRFIEAACPLAGARHAPGIRRRSGASCLLACGHAWFEEKAEGRDQVCAGYQRVVVDGVAHRGLLLTSWKAVFSSMSTRFHGVKVHVTIQDGIDIHKIGRPTGNLITGAVCAPFVMFVGHARRHRALRPGVVAKRDRRALTQKKVLRSRDYVRPRWAKRSGRECV